MEDEEKDYNNEEDSKENNNGNIHTGGSDVNYNISAGEIQLTDPENAKSNRHSRNNSNDRYNNASNKRENENMEEQENQDDDNENEIEQNYEHQQRLNNISEAMEPISEAENEEDKKQKSSQQKPELNDEYEKMFDEIMKKNKNSLIFKKDGKYQPLGNQSNKSIEVTGTYRTKTPVELTLYADATKRREKMQKTEYNHMMNIILDSSRTKISNASHKIAINKVEKMIDDVVTAYEKDKKVTFINVGEILTELKIFRETFPKNGNQKLSKNKSVQNYKDIQMEMINVKESDRRKQREVNFYEQLWLTLNPGNKPSIKSDILSEILKILFAPINSNVKEITEILKQFLLTAFFLNSNPEEVKRYISPITEKDVSEDEIWPIEKLVREFLFLKENLLAYQGIKHFNKTIQGEITKTAKEMSFTPKINESTKDWDYFNKRLPALVEREKVRLQVLEEMKKENEENDLKECSFKPQINKTKSTFNQRNSAISIYDKLYSTNKDKYERYKQIKEAEMKKKEDKELESCTFKPQLVSQKTYKKCISSTEKPRGFDEFSQKMREGIIKAAEKKYKENKIPTGENYEKVKKANIQPFDITDLRKKDGSKSKYSYRTKNKNEDFFTIEIKIPNGKERTLKIYLSDDPYDIADNFCKTYCLKEEIKERLAKTILNFRNLYLQKNNIKENSQTHS